MQEKLASEIEELYIEQYDMLLAYALRMLKNDALAEEAVQETFRIACQKAAMKRILSDTNFCEFSADLE